MLKRLLLVPAAALVLLYVSGPRAGVERGGHGSLFLDGCVVGTVVPPAQMPAGTGQDPFYKVTNGASVSSASPVSGRATQARFTVARGRYGSSRSTPA